MTVDPLIPDWPKVTFKSEKVLNVMSDPQANFLVYLSNYVPASSQKGSWALLDQSDFINQTVQTESFFVEQSQRFEEQFKAAFGYTQRVSDLCERLETIEHTLVAVVEKLAQNVQQQRPLWVPIESLTPEPYVLQRPLTAVLTPVEDGFEAGLFEANLFASGDTEPEAVANLKSVLLDTYETLQGLGDSKLGPGPLRQKKVLDTLIRKTAI